MSIPPSLSEWYNENKLAMRDLALNTPTNESESLDGFVELNVLAIDIQVWVISQASEEEEE